ncbi:hypothetical protein SAMN06893096_11092 [Geodermatophilus pulveris]|uniref:Uncharacterized protein n=1 Tax=Geodermatophilus pulveris TaxID=1564159 RepID=A0A239ICF4_9ACTN|nr:hypothetical protein [Geodermatophilus pulveris]SNS90958.1 hypothetical protein SAMN06893096_11092 [Geodermatophilus pulveris]
MTRTVTRTAADLGTLDLQIVVAHSAVRAARSAAVRCPSGENARRVAEAEAEVDALLDRRLALR